MHHLIWAVDAYVWPYHSKLQALELCKQAMWTVQLSKLIYLEVFDVLVKITNINI